MNGNGKQHFSRMNNNPFLSSIIDIIINGEANERILTIAARGTPRNDKVVEIAIKLNHLNIRDENDEWKIIEFGKVGEAVTQLVADSKYHSIYAGTSLGNIYKSIDHGNTWELVLSGIISNCLHLAYSPIVDTVYACSNDKAISSDDGGRTWKDLGLIWNE